MSLKTKSEESIEYMDVMECHHAPIALTECKCYVMHKTTANFLLSLTNSI